MQCKRIRKWTALALTVATLTSQMAVSVSAEEPSAEQNNLWLTEIYQNDVKRTDAYQNDADHMEFVEITNTGAVDIDLNDGYGLWYAYPDGEKQLTVTTVAGDSETVTIPAGKCAVLWNQRTDIGGTEGIHYASEAQFREAMNIPEEVPVYRVSGQKGFTENDRGFAIKDQDGTVLSAYHYNAETDEVTADGLAVHLKVPASGSTMLVWQKKKLTSAGVVYDDQLSGLRPTTIPDAQPEGVYITEIRPNDSNRDAVYGSGSNDLMECLELTNTTDKEVDLNQEYELSYRIKEGSCKKLPLYHLDAGTGDAGSSEGCTIPAHGTAVLWCYRAGHGLVQGKDYTIYPTEAEFRAEYEIPDHVPVYIFIDQNGLSNELRGIDLYHLEDDGKRLVSRYFWDGDSVKDNRSVDLKVSANGPLMEVYAAQSVTNMGAVAPGQITFPKDDGTAPKLTLSTDPYDAKTLETLKNGLAYGESLRIPYNYSGTADLPVTHAELFWKTDRMEEYQVTDTKSFAIYNKWYAFVQNGDLQGADYVDYYVRMHNAYRFTQTEVQRVQIHKDSEQSGSRISINAADVSDGDYSGTVQVSAKDFGGNIEQILLDGKPLDTQAAMERGAYLVFDYTGVDSYFKNGVTTGGDTEQDGTIIGTFSKCSTIPTDGCLAMPINGQYFDYQPDGSATIELTIRPATYGSCWEAYTEENNEDFVASNLKLVLRDGTEISPTTCKGENITTGEVRDLDAASPIKIGDTANQYIYVKMTFRIPAEQVDKTGLTAAVDTTQLTDGKHTLTAGDAMATFTVNNSDPQPVTPAEPELNVSLRVDEDGNTVTVEAVDGVESVSVRRAAEVEHITVKEGAGDSTFEAAEQTAGGVTKSENGEYPYQILEIPVTGSEEYLRIQLTAESSYGKPVQLYVLKDGIWELLSVERGEDSALTALCPVSGCIEDGVVQVLVQARTTANTPTTQEDAFKTSVGDNASWDGKTVTAENPYAAPEQYDFSIAWYTDTQYYSERYNQHYADMVSWIIENREDMNIQYVLHTGDIADEFNEEYQFAYARQQQDRLQQAGIPTGVLGGNHDVAHGNMVYDLYWKYFGAQYYLDTPWYGGSYRNNLGHYDIIEAGGEEILFIDMSWDIYTPEIEWINAVLDAYPDTRAIITTHGGINASASESYTSRILLEGVCKNHPQVMAILNGHFHGSSINFVELTSDAGETHTVYQICTDYQSATEGGSGYIKMLYFDLANDKIYINSYSPSAPDMGGKADVNYYDGKALLDYSDDQMTEDEKGIRRYTDYDIDVVALPVEFDRETEKTLTVSELAVTGLYSEQLAAGESNNAIPMEQAGGLAYAVLLDSDGAPLAYTNVGKLTGTDSGEPILGYTVTFAQGEHFRVDVYNTQDYTTPSATNVTTAVARNAETGQVDITGDGQVNFKVLVEDGYEIAEIKGDQNFKNLKGPEDTGAENIYRLTKVTGPVNVTITVQKSGSAEPGYTPVLTSNVRVNGYYDDTGTLNLELAGRYNSGAMNPDGGSLEIVQYNSENGYAYAVSGVKGKLMAVDLNGTLAGEKVVALPGTEYDLKEMLKAQNQVPGFVYGDMTSVDISPDGTKLAAALQHAEYDKAGVVAVFTCNSDGTLTDPQIISVGVQPDMVTFAEENTLLTADEGEPRKGYGEGITDPAGTVSIVDLKTGTSEQVGFEQFSAEELISKQIIVGVAAGKNLEPKYDLEPEYIAVSGKTAYVSLQEANAIAVLDLESKAYTGIYSCGYQDYAAVAVDLMEDGQYAPKTYENLVGARMPDGIAVVRIDGKAYVLTANEGDAREWGAYTNESKDESVTGKKIRVLNPEFCAGLPDGKKVLFGGRSFTVFEVTDGGLREVYDSREDFERVSAEKLAPYFNCSNDDVEIDSRSAKKGPEPETIAVGQAGNKKYAFIALERVGGIMVYDITAPANTTFVNYINSREFEAAIQGDVSPEGLCFVPSGKNGNTLLLAAHEVSGTLAVYDLTENQTGGESGGSTAGGTSAITYPVIVDRVENGSVTVTPKSGEQGRKITVTVKENEGYELHQLTVTDGNGAEVAVTKVEPGKYTFTMPASKVTVTAVFARHTATEGFQDVPENAYYSEAVEWAVKNGITSGTTDTTFRPDASCTRAQAVTFLWRAAGSPDPKNTEMPFRDVAQGSYYYNAVLWAMEQGITAGMTDTTFAPDATCTRGQIVTFLYRSQGAQDQDRMEQNPFTDVGRDSYYGEAVLWAVANHVTAGTSATTFSPDADCTRAQIVSFLYRSEKA